MEGKNIEFRENVEFKYIFSENYQPQYVNGAHGGITTQGEIVVHFFLERPAIPNSELLDIASGEVKSSPENLNEIIIRSVSIGAIMNLQTAKSIHEWLGSHIQNIESTLAINTEGKK